MSRYAHRRGLKSSIPTANSSVKVGEIITTTDTNELYIGDSLGVPKPQKVYVENIVGLDSGILSIVTKNSNYSVQVTDDIIFVDCSSGDVTLTLPLSSTMASRKRMLYFKKIDSSSNKAIIVTSGSEKMDDFSAIFLDFKNEVFSITQDTGCYRIMHGELNNIKFDASTIPDCINWWPADLVNLSNLSTVSTFYDAGSAALNLTSSGGNRPLYDVFSQNQKPGLDFSSATRYMMNSSNSAFNFLHNGSGCTIFFATKQLSVTGTQVLFENNNNAVANRGFCWSATANQISYTVTKGTGAYVINSSAQFLTNKPYIITVKYQTQTGNDFFVRQNGVQVIATGELSTPTTSNASTALYLGGRSVNNTYFGVVYEVILFDRQLTTNETAIVENYLSEKYNIPLE